MFEQERYTVTVREDGVTVARGFFCYPRLSKEDLCFSLAKECEAWFRSVLAQRATAEYREDPSPKKRFFFPSYEYRWEASLPTASNTEATLTLTVTLSRAGKRLSCYQSTERIRLSDRLLLPPKRKKHGH